MSEDSPTYNGPGLKQDPQAPPAQVSTIGRIVHYRLSAQDAEQITRRRTDGRSIRNRLIADPPQWPAGAQAHIGNPVTNGQVFPMLITACTPGSQFLNGQVFLDGNDVLWVTSCAQNVTLDGCWFWPPRV